MSARRAKQARLTPRTIRNHKDLCELPRDNVGYKHFWFSVSETTVTVCEQTSGQPAKAMITLPKRVFDSMVDWYNGAKP